MASRTPREGLREVQRLVSLTPVRNACDLDLLLFLHRHPRVLLTSERLAAFVGYGIKEIAQSLEAFIDAGLLERTQNPMHAARMYLLLIDGPGEDGLRRLLTLASSRTGRQGILQALASVRSDSDQEPLQRARQILKIA